MFTLTAFRQSPFYMRFFGRVRLFLWPVIWWTFNRLIRACLASDNTEYLIGVTRRPHSGAAVSSAGGT